MLPLLTFVAALGCAVISGVFFAFSIFVMRALGRLPAPLGIAAMQSINIAVLNPLFLTVFIGTGAICVLLLAFTLLSWERHPGALRLAGSALYLVGVVGVTRAFNIPRNDALAAMDPDSSAGASLWARYLREWTAWNHVRTFASFAAAAALAMTLPGLNPMAR